VARGTLDDDLEGVLGESRKLRGGSSSSEPESGSGTGVFRAGEPDACTEDLVALFLLGLESASPSSDSDSTTDFKFCDGTFNCDGDSDGATSDSRSESDSGRMAGAGTGRGDLAIEDIGGAGEAPVEGADSGGCGRGSAERGENLIDGSGAPSLAPEGVLFRDFGLGVVSLVMEGPAAGGGTDWGGACWTGAGVDSRESPVRSTTRPDTALGFLAAWDDRRSRAGCAGLAGLTGISSSSSVRSMTPCPPTMGILGGRDMLG
jgi:hypothetical protein